MLKRLYYFCFARCIFAILRLRRLLLWCADGIVPAALPLYAMTSGIAQTQMVASFVALGLPERLRLAPATLHQLVEMSHADEDVLARFLRSCQALGLVRRDAAGRFRANARTHALCRDAPSSMAAFAGYMASGGNTQAWQALSGVITTGQDAFTGNEGHSVWSYFEAHPNEGAQFAAAMTALARADGAAIAHAYPFGRHTRICDVGGGQGALLQAIVRVHPHVHGVVFDQASVVQALYAPQSRAHAANASPLTFVAGSFFEGFPTGCDAYVLRHILHDWPDEACVRILSQARRAMHDKARLLIIESWVEPDDVDFVSALKDLTMAVVCGGRERGRRAMRGLLAASDLRLVRTWRVAAAVTIWEAARTKHK